MMLYRTIVKRARRLQQFSTYFLLLCEWFEEKRFYILYFIVLLLFYYRRRQSAHREITFVFRSRELSRMTLPHGA